MLATQICWWETNVDCFGDAPFPNEIPISTASTFQRIRTTKNTLSALSGVYLADGCISNLRHLVGGSSFPSIRGKSPLEVWALDLNHLTNRFRHQMVTHWSLVQPRHCVQILEQSHLTCIEIASLTTKQESEPNRPKTGWLFLKM